MTKTRSRSSADPRYLAQEAALILLLGYVILAGGTFNGVVLARVQRVNTALLGVVGAIWLGFRLLRRRPFPRTSLDLPLIGYLLAFALTAALSIDPRRSAGEVWRLGLYVLAFYFFVDLLRHGWTAELFTKVLLIIGAIVLAFGIWYLLRWYLSWQAIWSWTRPIPAMTSRMRSIIGSSNWVAAFVNLLWPFALFRLIEAKDWATRVWSFAWLLVAALVVYFTSSRGGWLGTASALGAALLLSARLREKFLRLIRWLTTGRWRLLVGTLGALGAGAFAVIMMRHRMALRSYGGGLSTRTHFWHAAALAFRASPFTGSGPLTYGETYFTTHSVPPQALYAHAHSYPINLVAESGLIGLTALAWVTISLAAQICRSLRRSPPKRDAIRTAALAALVGCAAHSQFETVQRLPAISLILALLLALLHAPEDPRHQSQCGFRWILPVGWSLLLGIAIWSAKTTSIFGRGVAAANAGRWEEATALLDAAVERDSKFAHYHFQAGYAHGVRAQWEPAELGQAVEHYKAGIQRSPNYALNAANLSALHRQAGDGDKALGWMEHAVDLAPQSALLRLNLGVLYEELGQQESSRTEYVTALDKAPHWSDAYFWRATPLRSSVLQAWHEAQPETEPVETPETAEEWYQFGRQAMAAGDHEKAFSALQQALDGSPYNARYNVAQAGAVSVLGRDEEAEKLLRTALLTTGGREMDRARVRFAQAQLYHRESQVKKAIRSARSAIRVARNPAAHIGGRLGNTEYAHYLFHAPAIPQGLLPQVVVIIVTDEVAAWMLELGSWYEEVGDTEAAAQLYQELLEEVPDAQQARDRLDAIELGVDN